MSSISKELTEDLETAVGSVERGITDLEYAIQNTGDVVEDLEDKVIKLEKQLETADPLSVLRTLRNIRLYIDNTIKRLEKANETTSKTPDSDSGIGSPGSG